MTIGGGVGGGPRACTIYVCTRSYMAFPDPSQKIRKRRGGLRIPPCALGEDAEEEDEEEDEDAVTYVVFQLCSTCVPSSCVSVVFKLCCTCTIV